MSQQTINLGTADKGNGDPLRTAFGKINANFTELYATAAADLQLPIQTSNGGKYLTTDGTTLSWATVDSNRLVNGSHIVSLSSVGLTTFPAISNESLFIQASELGSANASIGISAKNSVIVTADILDTAKQWTFGTEGKLTLPAGTTYEYLSAPLTGHGDGLARLDFSLVTDGVITDWMAASADPAGSGYSPGNTFTFDEVFLGIPGASVTIEVLTVGPGGSVENLGFTPGPLYPADIYRNSPVNLQVGTTSSNRWTFGAGGDLTLPANGGIVFDRADTSIRVGMGFHIASGEGISLDAIDQTAILTLTGAGNGPVNQTYNKTTDTVYTGNTFNFVTVVNLGGTWFVLIDGDAKYTSNDLIGWALSTGPGPAPTGVLSNGYKSWGFNPDGILTFPGGANVRDLPGATTNDSILILGAGATVAENQRAARVALNGSVEGVAIGAGINDWLFTNDGNIILPAGGTITEGVVTSNPTIQLTPASPTVASQKLVIKGGGIYNAEANGIALNWDVNTALVGDTIEIYVYSLANANQTLYWWIHPAGAGISDPGSGTVALGEFGSSDGPVSFVLDSDDYEFTVRVSPVDNVYDLATTGVETSVFNSSAPSFGNHHLHLTTGNLAETSIFLGTDDHNVRTTVNGGIEITTPNTINNVWTFDPDGKLTLPGSVQSETDLVVKSNHNTLYYSNQFDGSQSITILDSAELQLGDSTAFTIEAWIYETVYYPTKAAIIVQKGGTKNVNYATYQLTLNNETVTFDTGTGSGGGPNTGGKTVASSTSLPLNQWVHIAVVWNGTTITLYQNGVSVGTTAAAPLEMGNNTDPVTIGTIPSGGTDDNFVGKISNLRIVKNTAVYTGAFTPSSTPLTAITNTSLLTCNAQTINVGSGTATVVNESPFGANSDQTWTFGADGTIAFPDTTVQTTAYPGVNTVAKTGSGVPGTGEVATMTASPTSNSNFIPGIYSGLFLGLGSGISLTLEWPGFGDFIITITGSGAGFNIGDQAILNGAAIPGGTTGVDDITLTVATLTNIATPTALDLTKQVQKLTDGYYSLANGVEGQVMHLVRQTGATVSITVIVANARVSSAQYTTIEHYPFTTGDIDMLIFTDGAWQANSGTWD